MSDICPRHNCEPKPSHLGMFCPECLREGHFGSDADTGCDDDKLPGTADDWRKPLQPKSDGAIMPKPKSWSDYHREAIEAGTDDASACHQADEAMARQEALTRGTPEQEAKAEAEVENLP